MRDGAIIVGGVKYVVSGTECRTWLDTNLHFGHQNAPRRDRKAHWGVIHWTASERSGDLGAAQIHRSLSVRGLSVEFFISNEGTVYQFVDPAEQRCKHCSRLNKRSVGIEVSGMGWVRKGTPLLGATTLRRQYKAAIHGWRTRFFDFLPEQQRSLNALCGTLSAALDIDPVVLTDPWERRSDAFFRTNSGFCGHLHAAWLKTKHPKTDPGTAPLLALERYFAAGHVGIVSG